MSSAAAVLILLGALVAFTGSLGLLTLKTFYERVHPPTMGATLGVGLVVAGSMLHFGTLHELLVGAFMLVSTPVTYLLLMRAALTRG
jgi:multicomponent K+:H+ antiporter subunit G